MICTLCYKQIILICDYQVDEAMWLTEKAVQKAKSEWKEAHALMEELVFMPQFLTFKAWVWAAATVSKLMPFWYLDQCCNRLISANLLESMLNIDSFFVFLVHQIPFHAHYLSYFIAILVVMSKSELTVTLLLYHLIILNSQKPDIFSDIAYTMG